MQHQYKICDCTPLVFLPAEDDPQATALRYTQQFTIYDHIVVQFYGEGNWAYVYTAWYNATTDAMVGNVLMERVSLGGGRNFYSGTLPVLDEGLYYVKVGWYSHNIQSATFEIVREASPDSMLIEYSSSDNDTPLDNMFIIGGVRKVFRLRIEGGFKPQGYTPSVAQETWRTQRQELRQLYSAPYDKWTLTIGRAQGVPVEYIRMINAILSCDMVYINGQRWCRSEGSVPEKQLTMQGAQMFTASVDMERQFTLEDYPQELYAGNGDYNGDYNNDYDKMT